MQYQHTANSLAAQGRNGDSMLMHVTPREVAGLQSLAQRHGGSLTTNPHTGLPEANVLDDIGLGGVNKALPTLVGAGLTYFSGGAIDPMTAAAMVGGLAGLSSGSLSQGIQAGLGAYGGASLTGTLGAMGGAANANAAVQAADAGATGPLSGNAFSNAASAPDVGAGLSAAAAHPVDFLKQNAGMLGAALLPSLMSSGEQESGPAALTNKGYIRRYAKNPRTGALEQAEAVPVDDWGSRPAVSFGGVGEPVKYADGGSITDGANLFTTLQNSGLFNKPNASGTQNTAAGQHLVYNEATKKYDTVNSAGEPVGPVTFGGVPQSTVMRDPNDTRSDSQKAYDYLMGNTGAKNPMLFYHDQGAPTAAGAGAAAPLDMATRTGGHYVFNQSSNNYDWVPDTATSTADAAGLAALAARGTPGNNGGLGNPSAPSAQNSAVASNTLSNIGQIALGKIANALNLGDTTSYSPTVSDAQGISNDGGGTTAAMNGGFGLGLGTGSSTGGGGAAGLGGTGVGGTGPGSIGAGGSPGSTGTGSGVGTGGVGPTCFVKGVLVTLANGKQVAIENVEVGDVVRGQDGDNQVIAFDRPQLIIPDVRDGTLYGFNGGAKFITSEHPVMTKDGWKAVDQDKAKQFEPHLSEVLVGNLDVGDEILMLDGSYLVLESIDAHTDQPQQQLYNLMLSGDHTYYVNGLLVHNKGDGSSGWAQGGIAALAGGGLGSLGGYSDGGQLLKGPGDGVSDSIPATIGRGQPARLADGEFVIPSRIVSELGNGSTEAGAKQLYAMLARIQAGRAKTTGKNQVATDSKAARHLPA